MVEMVQSEKREILTVGNELENVRFFPWLWRHVTFLSRISYSLPSSSFFLSLLLPLSLSYSTPIHCSLIPQVGFLDLAMQIIAINRERNKEERKDIPWHVANVFSPFFLYLFTEDINTLDILYNQSTDASIISDNALVIWRDEISLILMLNR